MTLGKVLSRSFKFIYLSLDFPFLLKDLEMDNWLCNLILITFI